MKQKKKEKEKITTNLSGFLLTGWLNFIEETGKDLAYGPHFKKEHFIRHIRTVIMATQNKYEITNDMGDEGRIFYGNPWEI